MQIAKECEPFLPSNKHYKQVVFVQVMTNVLVSNEEVD